MTIKDGGQLQVFGKPGQKLSEISIRKMDGERAFELWIKSNPVEDFHGESLSYLTIGELLDLKDEINSALGRLIS